MISCSLVSSLRATGFDGTIAVLSSGAKPCLREPGPNLLELRLPDSAAGWAACDWKYRSRELIDGARYRRILYLDSDCLAVADVRPLLEGDWDLAFVPEYGAPVTLTYFNAYLTDDELATRTEWGVNAGTFAVRGSLFAGVMSRFEQIRTSPPLRPLWRGGSEQAAWNRLVLDTELATRAFDEGEVLFPFVGRRAPPAAITPRIVHVAGVEPRTQLQVMCQTYFELFGMAPRLPG